MPSAPARETHRHVGWKLRALAGLVALGLSAALPQASQAQDANIRLGQSLRLSGTTLEVVSQDFEVDQATGNSIFRGEVLAVQGELRLTAGELRLEYSGGTNGEARRINRLLASGGVTMVTPSEAIEAREAVYQLGAGTLEMQGDVMLVQGSNILTGQRFNVDLESGAGRISGGVRTVIQLE